MNHSFVDICNWYYEEGRKMANQSTHKYKCCANYKQKQVEKAHRKADNRKKNKAARKARKKNK